MNTESSRNEGVRVIAEFDDRAIPLGEEPAPGGPKPGSEETAIDSALAAVEAVLRDTPTVSNGGGPAAGDLDALITRIESAVRAIHAALGEIKQLRRKAG